VTAGWTMLSAGEASQEAQGRREEVSATRRDDPSLTGVDGVLLAVRAQSSWPGPGQQIFCLRENTLDPDEQLDTIGKAFLAWLDFSQNAERFPIGGIIDDVPDPFTSTFIWSACAIGFDIVVTMVVRFDGTRSQKRASPVAVCPFGSSTDPPDVNAYGPNTRRPFGTYWMAGLVFHPPAPPARVFPSASMVSGYFDARSAGTTGTVLSRKPLYMPVSNPRSDA